MNLGKNLGSLVDGLIKEQKGKNIPDAQDTSTTKSDLHAAARYKKRVGGAKPAIQQVQSAFVPRTDLIVPLSKLDLNR